MFLFGLRATTFVAMLLCGWSLTANAVVITFEEIPPGNGNGDFLSEEYATLGIHFITTNDGSIWGGLSAGDPGNWDLEGTNGPAFLGFNGSSYESIVNFDVEMSHISLDVSRSAGSAPGNTFTLEAYSGATLVDAVTVELGPINSWTSVSVSGDAIDRTVLYGIGSGFHPFGVDNLIVVPEPTTICLLGLGGLLLRRRKSV